MCTLSPPHNCENYYNTGTEEEYEVLERWETLSREQAGGERRRPDLQCDEEGFYPLPFWCALLQKIRPQPENFREEDRGQTSLSDPPHDDVTQETDVSYSSSLSSPREEPGKPACLDLEKEEEGPSKFLFESFDEEERMREERRKRMKIVRNVLEVKIKNTPLYIYYNGVRE